MRRFMFVSVSPCAPPRSLLHRYNLASTGCVLAFLPKGSKFQSRFISKDVTERIYRARSFGFLYSPRYRGRADQSSFWVTIQALNSSAGEQSSEVREEKDDADDGGLGDDAKESLEEFDYMSLEETHKTEEKMESLRRLMSKKEELSWEERQGPDRPRYKDIDPERFSDNVLERIPTEELREYWLAESHAPIPKRDPVSDDAEGMNQLIDDFLAKDQEPDDPQRIAEIEYQERVAFHKANFNETDDILTFIEDKIGFKEALWQKFWNELHYFKPIDIRDHLQGLRLSDVKMRFEIMMGAEFQPKEIQRLLLEYPMLLWDDLKEFKENMPFYLFELEEGTCKNDDWWVDWQNGEFPDSWWRPVWWLKMHTAGLNPPQHGEPPGGVPPEYLGHEDDSEYWSPLRDLNKPPWAWKQALKEK
mmetsp:Transcript_40317/g.67394  ORF Transcript_40317/g.67394 Transcript_40317/m.67394 type:complete len:418 (-) Transcript_40317:1026-2279(-)